MATPQSASQSFQTFTQAWSSLFSTNGLPATKQQGVLNINNSFKQSVSGSSPQWLVVDTMTVLDIQFPAMFGTTDGVIGLANYFANSGKWVWSTRLYKLLDHSNSSAGAVQRLS